MKTDGKIFSRASLEICLFCEGVLCLDLFGLFIELTKNWRWTDEFMESWGLCYFDRAVHLNWGSKCRVIELPWSWTHVKHEVVAEDGSWVVCDDWKAPDALSRKQEFDYTYWLDNGTKQNRKAIVYVERREWRWKWLTFLPWPRIVRTSINVTFDGEVGERAGSWKGGCIGCGYEMLLGESAEDTLRRMEQHREF